MACAKRGVVSVQLHANAAVIRSLLILCQGQKKQLLCGQAQSSQCVMLGSGVRKHAETRGVWGHAPPGKF